MFRTGLCPSSELPSRRRGRVFHKWGVAVVVAALGLAAGGLAADVQARERAPAELSAVALAALPAEAQQTHRLVLAGGPFPYAKDGVVFGNRERLLPSKARGHYREYTVKTPGAAHRGARRIVCGGQPPTQPEACYYTADHYSSFKRIEP